jgi:hypothetical protein
VPIEFFRSMRFVATLALAGACTAGEDSREAEPNDVAPTAVALTVTDSGFEARDTLAAGFIAMSLTNRGTDRHSASLLRLDSGKTLPEWIEAYREANRTRGARPSWATYHGGLMALGAEGLGTAILSLEPGNYAWVCFFPDSQGTSHLFGRNQAHPFVVRAASESAAAQPPVPTASILMSEYDFQVEKPLRAGRNVIRIANAGAEPHHVVFFRIATGKTAEDVEAWLQHGMQGEPPVTAEGAMDNLSGGVEAYLDVDLPPGDYVLVCLVAGRDEVPHTEKGMIRHVKVE